MGIWLERLLEQLLIRLWRVLAGRLTARLERELAATQLELLEQAATWRRDHGPLGEAVALRLEAASARLGNEQPGTDDVAPSDGPFAKPSLRLNPPADAIVTQPGKRSRGRPKKVDNPATPAEPAHFTGSADGNKEPFQESVP